jgi:tRNA-specific 2-thiouridylase
MGHPVYVCKLVPSENQVVIGYEEDLFSSIVEISDFNFMSIPELEIGQSVRGNIKIRYHHAGEWAMIERISEDRLKLTFDKPVKSATPGQSAVFYDEDGCVIGGGIIRSEAI